MPNCIPKITIIKPAGIIAQNNRATYFKIPSLYFKGTPKVLDPRATSKPKKSVAVRPKLPKLPTNASGKVQKYKLRERSK